MKRSSVLFTELDRRLSLSNNNQNKRKYKEENKKCRKNRQREKQRDFDKVNNKTPQKTRSDLEVTIINFFENSVRTPGRG